MTHYVKGCKIILNYANGSYILKMWSKYSRMFQILEAQGEFSLDEHLRFGFHKLTDLTGGKRMFKKYVIAAMITVMLTVMFGTSTLATGETSLTPEIAQGLIDIELVNEAIYAEIAAAQAEADELYAQYVTDYTNANGAEAKAALWTAYDEEVSALIHELDMKTREMTRIGVENATAAGITVEIEWVPVQFPDRVAMIDPIHVVGW